MTEENFSPTDSLQLINNMIGQARNRFSENGYLYLMWGWIIFFAAMGHFILLQLQWFKHPEIIWASCWVAVIYQVIYITKAKKKAKVKSYSEEIINYIWVSFGICMFVLSFILGKSMAWEKFYSIILMMYGIPTFLSGVVMQFKPLKVGGIICWCLAIIASLLAPIYSLPLLAVAVAVAWIRPGYLLRKKYNQQNN